MFHCTSQTFSLRVDGTQLQCKIEAELWGAALTFEEVHLVNNHFDMVDNKAFLPFKTTLKVLNLREYHVVGWGSDSSSADIYICIYMLIYKYTHIELFFSKLATRMNWLSLKAFNSVQRTILARHTEDRQYNFFNGECFNLI